MVRDLAMKPFRLARSAVDGFIEHSDLTLAASISYYTALSLAPLLILGLWVAASVSPNAQTELVAQVGALAGADAKAAVELIIENASRKPSLGSLAGVIGVLLLVLSATAVFSQLQAALNIIWDAEAPSGNEPLNVLWTWLRRRLFSVGILAAFVFVLIVSLAISTALAVLLPRSGVLWDAINQIVALVVFAVLFAVIFRYLPDARLSWRDTWVGALVTAILFAVGKYAIGEYLAHSGIAGSYGPAGSFAVLLVWVYYSATIFLFGAELVRAFRVSARKPARA